MTWLLLIHDNRARCIFACYRLADYDGMPNLHVKIVARYWYYLHNFKLLAWYNILPNRDCEHGVLLYRNYLRLPACWHYTFGFLSVSTYLLCLCASQICSPFTICCSFLVLNWKVGLEPGPTYLSWSNMFFYNCYPCNQIMCSIKMQSFLAFSM